MKIDFLFLKVLRKVRVLLYLKLPNFLKINSKNSTISIYEDWKIDLQNIALDMLNLLNNLFLKKCLIN